MKKAMSKIALFVGTIVIGLGSLSLNDFVSALVPGINQRVSLTSSGNQSSTGGTNGLLSPDGKFVVFRGGTSIMPSGGSGLFKRNIATGVVERVSVSNSGVIADASVTPEDVSYTGRYVLFRSKATNLIDGRTVASTVDQLYLRDTLGLTTTLVTQNLAGALSDSTWHESIGVSSDGRFVGFVAYNATNLNTDSTDGSARMYMLDRLENTLDIIDRKPDGTLATANSAWPPVAKMNCDGSMIAFQYGTDIASTGSTKVDTYLLDRRGASDKIIPISKQGNQAGYAPSISCNGDYIGFKSGSNNLDPTVTITYGGTYRPYVYNRINDSFHLAPITTSGAPIGYSDVCGATASTRSCVEISDNGIASFVVNDASLTGASGKQVYIRNIGTGTTELISRNSSGVPASTPYFSDRTTMSADGRVVLYSTDANNLVTGDSNGQYDVFLSQTGN